VLFRWVLRHTKHKSEPSRTIDLEILALVFDVDALATVDDNECPPGRASISARTSDPPVSRRATCLQYCCSSRRRIALGRRIESRLYSHRVVHRQSVLAIVR
jgi:hypothetical protein